MSSSAVKTVAFSTLFAVAVVLLSSHPFILKTWQEYISPPSYTCEYNGAKMEIVSLDPLVMYINDFITDEEVSGLLEEGEGRFRSSQVYRDGGKLQGSERTSQTAGLPAANPVVQCVKSRVLDFMGTTLSEEDDIGTLQLVRYEANQKFDLHHDWYPEPHKIADGRVFNRISSFFSFLDDNCTEGETYFPFIEAQNIADGEEKYREHEEGGVAFKPIRGNAIFWVNLFANGTGDDRTRHAGLPVADGTKVAMNIWPRKFYN